MNNPITTISRERLEYLSKVYGITQPGSEEAEMARALLAVMDTKPVGFISERDGPVLYGAHISLSPGTHFYTTPPAPSAPDCEWTFDESQYSWHSACDEDYVFTDGGPVENRVRFCQGCGGTVKVTAAPGAE